MSLKCENASSMIISFSLALPLACFVLEKESHASLRVFIDSPMMGQRIKSGDNLPIIVRATSDIEIASVIIVFDTEGDGNIDSVSDILQTAPSGPERLEFTFSGISGPIGPRAIHAFATDRALKIGTTTTTVTLSDVESAPIGISKTYDMAFGMGEIKSVAFAPGGQTALLGGSRNLALLVDLATGRIRHRLLGHTDEISSVDVSLDGAQ